MLVFCLQKYSLLILYPKCACATFEINMHKSASKQHTSKIEYARIFGDNGPIIYTCTDGISHNLEQMAVSLHNV